jgi:phage terminase large subunit
MVLNINEIQSWSYVEEPVVYDIEVQDNHNYFLQVGEDSVLVHNSSKTYSILQLLCTYAVQSQTKLIIDVVGQDLPNLYAGAITDFKRLLTDSPILREALINPRLDRGPFKFKNGSVIRFFSAQTAQDAKSGKRDILFINEANGIPYEVAFELIARTTDKVFIDYNPNARFWVHHEYEGKDDAAFIYSNFTHNKFIPPKIKKKILGWKEEYDRTGSVYWRNKWNVYGLGLTGVVEGVVIDHADACSFFPQNASHVIYGLDFGFKNNYTALVKVGYYNNAMYVKEILYEQGLNSMNLANMLEDIGIDKTQKIVADPANSEAITIIQDKGFNIVPAKKGSGSINAGLDLIQALPLYVTKDSTNIWTEVENYKYKQDINGRFTNNPIDRYNDAIDAMRYCYIELYGLRLRTPDKYSKSGHKRKMYTVK